LIYLRSQSLILNLNAIVESGKVEGKWKVEKWKESGKVEGKCGKVEKKKTSLEKKEKNKKSGKVENQDSTTIAKLRIENNTEHNFNTQSLLLNLITHLNYNYLRSCLRYREADTLILKE
jgi:hypothetical protein